jgi:flavin reductase (DIM6/NTAB) family NADH-FMN oxidoreductase RutF
MDSNAFDEIAASIDSAMAIVTTASGEERAGCLIGFHAQTSISPRRYAVWLSKANHTLRVALHSEYLAVHFLTSDDRDLAELFGTLSGDDTDKFTRCEWEPSAEGPPLLSRCPHRLLLRRTGMLDEGSDHVCFVTEPLDARSSGRFTPLRLSAVTDLVPGHTVEERPAPASVRASRDSG